MYKLLEGGINRIRLEFKAKESFEKSVKWSSINRIRLEFKVAISFSNLALSAGINRIRLEFKVICKKGMHFCKNPY